MFHHQCLQGGCLFVGVVDENATTSDQRGHIELVGSAGLFGIRPVSWNHGVGEINAESDFLVSVKRIIFFSDAGPVEIDTVANRHKIDRYDPGVAVGSQDSEMTDIGGAGDFLEFTIVCHCANLRKNRS